VALLFIVARHRPDLFTSLKQQFSREEKAGKVQILLDRRQGSQRAQGPEPDRRRYFVDEELRSLGSAIVRR
jgi:hypothetical protein